MLRDHPAVTLAGPGGCGKTTIALSVAAALESSFRDGVHIVDLGALDPDDDVAGVVAAGIGLPEVAADPVDALVTRLTTSELLLVLDTCERVATPVATLVNRLAAACPGVRVLVVSRRVLGTRGEQVFSIEGLAAPPPGNRDPALIAESPAVMTFTDRATRSLRVSLDAESAPVVAELVRRLDGLPLALEPRRSAFAHSGLPICSPVWNRRLRPPSPSTLTSRIDTERFERRLIGASSCSVLRTPPSCSPFRSSRDLSISPAPRPSAVGIRPRCPRSAHRSLSRCRRSRPHGRGRYHLLRRSGTTPASGFKPRKQTRPDSQIATPAIWRASCAPRCRPSGVGRTREWRKRRDRRRSRLPHRQQAS